jgi:hypothetical protein
MAVPYVLRDDEPIDYGYPPIGSQSLYSSRFSSAELSFGKAGGKTEPSLGGPPWPDCRTASGQEAKEGNALPRTKSSTVSAAVIR